METLDFTAILALLVLLEAFYVLVKTHHCKNILSKDAIHGIGTNLLLKFGFVFSVITFKILGNATAISLWGVYLFWRMHTENKKLMSGDYHL